MERAKETGTMIGIFIIETDEYFNEDGAVYDWERVPKEWIGKRTTDEPCKRFAIRETEVPQEYVVTKYGLSFVDAE